MADAEDDYDLGVEDDVFNEGELLEEEGNAEGIEGLEDEASGADVLESNDQRNHRPGTKPA